MPIEYAVDEERKVLIAHAHGALCDADLLDYGQRLYEDPSSRLADHELVDLSNVSSDSLVTSEGVRELARYWQRQEDSMAGGKLAIVAPTDLSFGLGRMYQMLRDEGPNSIQIFRKLEEAWRWLESPDA